MMQRTIGLLGVFLLFMSFSSCKKLNDISFTVNITHDDYNTIQATYLSTTIAVDGEDVPWDFDTFSNIGLGDTRSIPVSVESENKEVDVSISINPSGSGTPYTVSVSGVNSGDILDHTVGDATVSIR